eukprot:gene53748-47208_t
MNDKEWRHRMTVRFFEKLREYGRRTKFTRVSRNKGVDLLLRQNSLYNTRLLTGSTARGLTKIYWLKLTGWREFCRRRRQME